MRHVAMQPFAVLFSSLLVPALLLSSDFRTGQAAYSVIGQPSFSVSSAGITPTALSLAGGKLFVTDKGQRVLSYDVSSLLRAVTHGSGSPGGPCVVCLPNPTSTTTQSVIT